MRVITAAAGYPWHAVATAPCTVGASGAAAECSRVQSVRCSTAGYMRNYLLAGMSFATTFPFSRTGRVSRHVGWGTCHAELRPTGEPVQRGAGVSCGELGRQ